jgi:hypothetical protein
LEFFDGSFSFDVRFENRHGGIVLGHNAFFIFCVYRRQDFRLQSGPAPWGVDPIVLGSQKRQPLKEK